MTEDILRRLRNPELPCICTDVVLLDCHPCNARLDAADEIERLRNENQRLEEARFDLQASDFHCWVCADFLSTARRRTDIHRLKKEEKAVRGE
jgi:hypothetical protein